MLCIQSYLLWIRLRRGHSPLEQSCGDLIDASGLKPPTFGVPVIHLSPYRLHAGVSSCSINSYSEIYSVDTMVNQ